MLCRLIPVIRPDLIKKVFWAVIGTGLVLPAVLALLAIAVSLVEGKAVDISGIDLFVFVLVTVLFSLPYIVLGFIARAVLRKAFEEGGDKPAQRSFLLAGIYLGMTVFIALTQYACFTDADAAAVFIEVMVVPIFAPLLLFEIALPGIVIGAIVGLIAHSVWKFFRRSNGISKGRWPRE